MQSAEERRRLMSRLGSESITPLGAVLKCAAGIAVLAIIAAGPWAFVTSGGYTAAPAAGGQAAGQPERALPRSVAESKRVFDERHRAYESDRDGNVASVGEATRPSLAIE